MRKIFVAVFIQVLVISFLFSSCKSQQTMNASLEQTKIAIAASNAAYFQAFATGDPSMFISGFDTACWIMQPNAPALCGVDAPLDVFRTAYDKLGVRNGKFITIDIFGSDEEFVTEVGFWKSVNASDELVDSGTFLVLWKKTPDGWKRFRNSFNSDRSK